MQKRLSVLLVCVMAAMLYVQSAVRNTIYADEDYIVATVGEDKIYFSEIEKAAQRLNRFLKENFQTSKQWRLNYIRQYVARFALAKRAVREGLGRNEEVAFSLEQARRNILSDKILGDRLAEIKITEDDLKRYYEQNKTRYQIKEKIKISYIKLKSKREAERIVNRLNKGRSFKKVGAKKIVKVEQWISKDGVFVPGLENIPPDKLNALFVLGVGGTSEIIAVSGNQTSKTEPNIEFYIFHIDEKEPPRDRPFEEVRKQVEFEYSKRVRDKAINEFIRETFEQEKVRIYEDRVTANMQ